MGKRKTFLMVLLVLTVLLSVVLGLFWHMRHYVLVDMEFYPRGAKELDLRDREMTARYYEKLLRRIPGCRILWNVPFQNGTVSSDTKEITVSALTEEDIRLLQYFPDLETVRGENCTDYENLLRLWKQRQDLKVEYTVPVGSENYPVTAERVFLESTLPGDLNMLPYLPNLKSVLCGGGEAEMISALKEYCEARQLEFLISLGGEEFPLDTESVTLNAVTDTQVDLLRFLPALKQLHLVRPEASAENLLQLRSSCPEVTVTWEQELCGQVLSSTVEEIDLSDVEITSLEALDQQMAYFPEAKLVFLGECGLDNDQLAAHREQVRDRYKLVWTVSCGSLKTRTDATSFMPVRENVFYFNDDEAYNLRYCEDMICIDIGHMSIHNIDFVKYMPNLQYLILAHTQLQYIEPISSCKKLKFLELDWAPLKDLTPLKGCTALEDLNLGMVYADFAPVEEMTWLKNLWMVDSNSAARYRMPQVLTDTRVMVAGAATVANGWRDLDNYYAMRDLLGMNYMSW